MSTPSTTIDARTFAIGVLSVTACIFFVGLLLVNSAPPAQAIGMSDRSGDYVVCTQQLTTSNEGVIVLDAAAKRMIVYSYDYNRRQLKPLAGFELSQLQTAAPADNRQP
ncbi:MAG: hypothetical protein PVJ57_02690 [Phycisphaerae bacterium]|jgi:hypothetical protein